MLVATTLSFRLDDITTRSPDAACVPDSINPGDPIGFNVLEITVNILILSINLARMNMFSNINIY
jgi:hypothetical protein